MHENNKRNATLMEKEKKTRKRNKITAEGGCSSDQGVCRK